MIGRRIGLALIIVILVAQALTLVTSARGENQTIDEGVHLAAGFSYWKTGDFRMNPEHPPLLKLLASVPLLFTRIHLPTDDPSWSTPDEWAFARTFLYANTLPAQTILLLGRLSTMIFAVALGILLAWWSWRAWGWHGAVFSTLLYASDTTVLAHGRYVTTDSGVAFFIFLTMILFTRFLQNGKTRYVWFTAVACALAQASKFSALILWSTMIVVWAMFAFRSELSDRYRFSFLQAVKFFGIVLSCTLVFLFVLYRGDLRTPLSDKQFSTIYGQGVAWQEHPETTYRPLVRAIQNITNPATRSGHAIHTVLFRVPVPLYAYVRGFSQVTWHQYWGHSSYLFGRHSTSGWWWYFPAAFFVKESFAVIVVCALLFAVGIRWSLTCLVSAASQKHLLRERARNLMRSISAPALIACASILIYVLSSMTGHLNLGVRHLLPIFPFLFFLAGALPRLKIKTRQMIWKATMAVLALSATIHAAITYPHFLAGFSELVGGPEHGAAYLLDSNLDWGQELLHLRQWKDAHHVENLALAYYGETPPDYYLVSLPLPTTLEWKAGKQVTSWAAISATLLYGSETYSWLRDIRPSGKVGYAIFVYDFRNNQVK